MQCGGPGLKFRRVREWGRGIGDGIVSPGEKAFISAADVCGREGGDAMSSKTGKEAGFPDVA